MKPRKTLSLEQRFLRHVLPEPNSGCWLWDGWTHENGYGQFIVGTRKTGRKIKRAHRISYELFVGLIPEHLELDHLCRVRCCVNPDHLEAVTRSVNVRRGISAQRRKERAAAQTHCKRGHLFSEENIVRDGNKRGCRTCINLRRRVGFNGFYAEKL